MYLYLVLNSYVIYAPCDYLDILTHALATVLERNKRRIERSAKVT